MEMLLQSHWPSVLVWANVMEGSSGRMIGEAALVRIKVRLLANLIVRMNGN